MDRRRTATDATQELVARDPRFVLRTLADPSGTFWAWVSAGPHELNLLARKNREQKAKANALRLARVHLKNTLASVDTKLVAPARVLSDLSDAIRQLEDPGVLLQSGIDLAGDSPDSIVRATMTVASHLAAEGSPAEQVDLWEDLAAALATANLRLLALGAPDRLAELERQMGSPKRRAANHPEQPKTLREGIVAVLGILGPSSISSITEEALSRFPGISKSETPRDSVAAALSSDIKKRGAASAFRRVSPGIYGLREGAKPSRKPQRTTPEGAFKAAAARHRDDLESQVGEKLLSSTPSFLEKVVVDLLIEMGYGGGDPKRGWVTGGTGDGGIDGTIREDSLGLDELYVQVKKYAAGKNVGANLLREFVGAVAGKNMSKGVFVTTSKFTRSAREFVEKAPQRIVLIDGKELARLMVTYRVGLRVRSTYAIKRIDQDYFNGSSAS